MSPLRGGDMTDSLGGRVSWQGGDTVMTVLTHSRIPLILSRGILISLSGRGRAAYPRTTGRLCLRCLCVESRHANREDALWCARIDRTKDMLARRSTRPHPVG